MSFIMVELKIFCEHRVEVKMCLRCLNCGTFITSPSFGAVKKHFTKCQLRIHGKFSARKYCNKKSMVYSPCCSRYSLNNEDVLLGMNFDDFIAPEAETVTISQPSLVLKPCTLEHSNFQKQNTQEIQSEDSLSENDSDENWELEADDSEDETWTKRHKPNQSKTNVKGTKVKDSVQFIITQDMKRLRERKQMNKVSNEAELPLNNQKTVVQFKAEPELTIMPDAIESDELDFQNEQTGNDDTVELMETTNCIDEDLSSEQQSEQWHQVNTINTDEATNSVPVSTNSKKLNTFQNKRVRRTQRKSHLEATKKLSQLMQLENGTDSVSVNVDKDWEMEDADNVNDNGRMATNSKGGFNCDVCKAWFKRERFLKLHKRNVHSSKAGKIFTCSICNRMTKGSVSFHSHLNMHAKAEASEKEFNLWKQWPKQSKRSEVDFKCKYCLMTQTNHSDFLSHMATEHSDKGQHYIHQCPYHCSAQLHSISELIAHFKSAHLREYSGFQLNSDEFIVSKRGDQLQKCDQCGKFYHVWYIAEHKEKVHSNVRVEKNRPIICAYPNCEIKFTKLNGLRHHFILHLENNPYVCNFPGCKVKGSAPSRILTHIKLQHLNAPLICAKCGVSYITKQSIKSHQCQDNLNKLKSGDYKLVKIEGFYKIKPVKYKHGKKLVDPKLNECVSKDKVNEYIESLKRIKINPIIKSDPGFIKACENSPGFGELLFGPQYHGEKFGLYKTYKCVKCCTLFGGQRGYARHAVHCKPNSGAAADNTQCQIGCEICGKSFEKEQMLEKHVTQEHGYEDIHKCDASGCGRYFSSAGDKQGHFLRMHTRKQCKKCRCFFENQTSLDQHMEEHRLNPNFGESKKVLCEVCGKTYASLYNRKLHMQSVHGITAPTKQDKSNPKKKPIINNLPKRINDFTLINNLIRYACNVCSAKFKRVTELQRHKRFVHIRKFGKTLTCPICNRMTKHKAGKNNGLYAHLNHHRKAEESEKQFNLWKQQWPSVPGKMKGRPFQLKSNCKFCLTNLCGRRKFLAHMATEHPGKGEHHIFKCTYNCSAQCDSIADLISHIKSNHPKEYFEPTKPSIPTGVVITDNQGQSKQRCEYCGKCVALKNIAIHHAKMHSKEIQAKSRRSFKCPFPACGIKYKSVFPLKNHFIYHLENNPFVCKFTGCNVKFSHSLHLVRHMKLQHLEAPPTCSKCGVSYREIKNLNSHNCDDNIEKIHSGKFKLVEISGLWKIKNVQDAAKCSSKVVIYDPDEVRRVTESSKNIEINPIIRSDPVFIQACKDSPGFGELLLGTNYFVGANRPFANTQSKTYKCSKCPTIFSSIHGYIKHKELCTGSDACGNIRIGCPICGKSFENQEIVEKHLSQDHKPGDVFKCDVHGCGKYFDSSHRKQQHYKRFHIGRPFWCEKCKRGFINESSYDKHMEEHRLNADLGANKTWFNCDVCSARYLTEENLRRHKQNVHISKIGEIFTCSICNRMTKSRFGYIGHHNHLNLHAKAEASEKKFNFWKQWPTNSNRSQLEFSCKFCLMVFTNQPDFLSHMATEHSDKGEHCTYQCPYNCSTQLESISELIAHFKSAHPEEWFGPRFTCEICSATFQRPNTLKIHKQNVHMSKTKHICTCPICDTMIEGIATFHRHLNFHAKAEASEKEFDLWKQSPISQQSNGSQVNFKCKYCLMAHKNHSDFLSHMATDHSGKGEHCTYQCPYNCSTKLDSISNLIAHFKSAHPGEYCGSQLNSGEFILNHRGDKQQKCDQCGKFYHLWYIAEHKATVHSNGRVEQKGPYVCAFPNCGSKFNAVGLLRRHFIRHLEKNPYVCNFAGCKFKGSAPSRVMEHIKLKHLNPPPICAKCGVSYVCTKNVKNHHCEDNINKLKSGVFKLVKIKQFWRVKSVHYKNEDNLEESPLEPKPNECDPNEKANQYLKCLKRIDINKIIASDPGFIQACKNSPGFRKLILGQTYEELGKKTKNMRTCKNNKLSDFIVSDDDSDEDWESGADDSEHNIWDNKRKNTKANVGVTKAKGSGQLINTRGRMRLRERKEKKKVSEETEFPLNIEKTVVQVKAEPELTIMPDDVIKTETIDLQTYEQIGKHETGE